MQTFSKLTALWNKQNRSVAASEKIKDALGMLLVTPGESRWNSVYDALCKVHSILCVPETEIKFDKLCDELTIKRLQPLQKTFVKEYVAVMKPVCCGLDVLQGETAVGLGFLLPTLSVMKSQLSSLLDANNVNDRLTVCEPLASCLVNAINGRFEGMFTNPDAQLAAVVHPKFKFDWIDNVYERSQLTDILKRRVSSLASSPTSEDGQSSSVTAVRTETFIQLQPVDFFVGLSARRQRNAGPLDVNQEVDKYLADSSDTCLLYTSPSPRDGLLSRMPSSA